MPFLRVLILIFLPLLSHADEPDSPVNIEAYGKLPGVEEMRISPSGKQLATVATINDQRILVVGKLGGAVSHKVGIGETKVRGIHWAGENFVIITLSSTQNLGIFYGGKHELYNFAVLNLKSGELDLPLANSKHVFNATFGVHRPVLADGRWYQCAETLPTKKSIHSGEKWFEDFDSDLTCIDLAKGRRKVVAKGRNDLSGWLIGPDLEVIAYETYDGVKGEWELFSYKSKSRLVKDKDPFGSNQILGIGRTPGTILYTVTDDSGGEHLMEIAQDGQSEPTELYPDKDIFALVYPQSAGVLRGIALEGDVPVYEFLEPLEDARIRGALKAFPDNYARFVSGDDSLQHIIVYTDGGRDSGTWWHVDIGEGSAEPIGYSHPEIRSKDVGSSTMISYSAADGLSIPAVLTLPPQAEAKSLPLIVLPHGGPQVRDYPGFDWWAQAFANRGYAVLQPNYRGSGHYGLAFRNAGFGEWGRKMQTDLSDGVAVLAEQGIVDPGRVCIVGGSYGGYAALAGVTVQQGIYRCAVSYAGISDLSVWLKKIRSDRLYDAHRYIEMYLGSNEKGFDFEAISPADRAKNANVPVLLIHGEDDTRVEPYHSKKMARELKSKDKDYQLIMLDGEDHFLSLSRTRVQMLKATMEFVLMHNPPGSAGE